MKKRTRLAAGLLAAATLTGAGAAAAAPAFADETVVLHGFPTKGICQIAEQVTGWAINATGGEIFAGDSCAYWGPDKLYGFSITYR